MSAIRKRSGIFVPAFDRLDVLVLAQGAVIYRRGEFEMAGFREVIEVNFDEPDGLCHPNFTPMLKASKGSLIIVSSTGGHHAYQGNPGLQCLEDRRRRPDLARWAQAWARGRYPRQRASRRGWSIPR